MYVWRESKDLEGLSAAMPSQGVLLIAVSFSFRLEGKDVRSFRNRVANFFTNTDLASHRTGYNPKLTCLPTTSTRRFAQTLMLPGGH
jgi:hypothetical protein